MDFDDLVKVLGMLALWFIVFSIIIYFYHHGKVMLGLLVAGALFMLIVPPIVRKIRPDLYGKNE